jgi:hypothetical protein
MTTRRAACSCGQLSITVEGDPIRISLCHCLACQRRTGSVFGVQARWPDDRVRIEGRSTEWVRVADSGNEVRSHFCPACGSTLYYRLAVQPTVVAIPVGGFADPEFPAPWISVYEVRRHGWVGLPADIEHHETFKVFP